VTLLHRVTLSRTDAERHDWQVLCPVGQFSEWLGSIENQQFVGDADREQQPMLVDRVEMVDQPYELAGPIGVRLESAERLPELLGGASYRSLDEGLPIPGCGRAILTRNRKRRLTGRGWDSGIGEVVEAGPHGVHRVTQDERDSVGDGGRLAADLGGALPGLRIILDDDVIWIGLMEGNDLRFEIIDVLFRAAHFGPNIIESTGHYRRTLLVQPQPAHYAG